MGVASIAIAETEEEARQALDAELELHGLRPHKDKPYTLIMTPLVGPRAMVLCDGEY